MVSAAESTTKQLDASTIARIIFNRKSQILFSSHIPQISRRTIKLSRNKNDSFQARSLSFQLRPTFEVFTADPNRML